MIIEKKFQLLIVAFAVFNVLAAQGSNDKPQFGVSASLQGGQTDIIVPIWISDHAVFAPAVGILSIKDAGTVYSLGFAQRFYTDVSEIAPYGGFRGGVIIGSPPVGTSVTDFIVGIMGGGEYYFSPHFSAGVETQLNLGIADKKSNRFGTPGGTIFTTGTSIFATIYF